MLRQRQAPWPFQQDLRACPDLSTRHCSRTQFSESALQPVAEYGGESLPDAEADAEGLSALLIAILVKRT